MAARFESFTMSAAVGFCGAALAYSLVYVVQLCLFPPDDPITTLQVGRIAYYWRAMISFYVGALVAIGAHALSVRRRDRFDALLPIVAVITIATTMLQGVFLP